MCIKKLIDYYHNSVNIIDLVKSKNKYNKNKINLGWCGVFPPTRNGSAAASYYIVKKLQKIKDINLFLIPFEGYIDGKYYHQRIDKRIFKEFNITKINNSKPDIVVLFLLGNCCRDFADKLKVPYIIWQTIHDSIKETSEKKLFEEIKSCNYKKLFLTTQSAAVEYKASGLKNVSYFPLGIDRNIFKPQERSKDFTVAFLSRIVRYKGIIPFLKSIPIVLSQAPKVKFKFHAPFDGIVKPEEEMENLINNIKKEYPDNFIFDLKWNNYDNMNNVYKDVSLLVFPSNCEGFGVPLVEAMGCGIPSIILDKSPMNEIIKNGYTGYCLPVAKEYKDKFKELIDREDIFKYLDYINWAFPSPEDIADKIIYLHENPEHYDKISKNCVEYSKNFDLDKLVDELVKQAKEVASGNFGNR